MDMPSTSIINITVINIIIIITKKKLGDGLACYQCRSDEIAECGDPFISSRSNNYFTNMISFVFRFLQSHFISITATIIDITITTVRIPRKECDVQYHHF